MARVCAAPRINVKADARTPRRRQSASNWYEM